MKPRNHTLPIVLGLLPVALVLGILWGGHPQQLPGFLRRALVADQDTRVLNQAVNDVQSDYYRPLRRSQLVDASIAGLVAKLNDRFSTYFTPRDYRDYLNQSDLHFSGVGMEVHADSRGLLVTRVYDNSPASRSGLRAGDLITGVDGRSLAGVSERPATVRIKGRPGTPVTLTVRRLRQTFTRRVIRATVLVPVVASRLQALSGVKLGLVSLAAFNPGAHAEVRRAIDHLLAQGAKGILFDLRGNPGGLVEEARLVASIFIREGTIVTTRGRTQPSTTLSATGNSISASVPVVLVVDRGTASAAEIVAGALQDHHRATIVGSHTFGKGVFQEVQPLSNGGALDITVGEYFTPNGRNLGGGGIRQGSGIAPDVLAQSDPRAHRDRALAIALRTLLAKTR